MDPVTGPLATLSALSNIPQPDLLTGLGNVGNSLALMMFMMTDQLLLRAAAVMCNLFFVAFFLLQPIDPAPAYWNIAFALINGVQLFRIVVKNRRETLTGESRGLYRAHFQPAGASANTFMRLYHLGKWRDVGEGETIALDPEKLQLVARGRVEASLENGEREQGLSILTPGVGGSAFIGELQLLLSEHPEHPPVPAHADTSVAYEALTPVKVIEWRYDELRTVCEKDPELLGALKSAAGYSAATKVLAMASSRCSNGDEWCMADYEALDGLPLVTENLEWTDQFVPDMGVPDVRAGPECVAGVNVPMTIGVPLLPEDECDAGSAEDLDVALPAPDTVAGQGLCLLEECETA